MEINVPTAPSAGIAWEALKAYLKGHYHSTCITQEKAKYLATHPTREDRSS